MSSSRLADFKNNGRDEQLRNRRGKNTVELRKNKRLEQTMKKRNLGPVEAFDSADAATVPGGATTTARPTLADIPDISVGVRSSDPVTQLNATRRCRKLLAFDAIGPIDPVIESGLVPDFVAFLTRDESPELQYEAGWVLTNITSGEAYQTMAVAEAGAIPLLIRLVGESTDMNLKEQCIWCLSNIAGDGATLRDAVLEANILEPLFTLLSDQESLPISLIRNATWTLSNLCRGKPRPQYNEMTLHYMIQCLVSLIYHDDQEVMTDALWALGYLSDCEDTAQLQTIMTADHLLARLLHLLESDDSKVLMPTIRCIGNFVTGDDDQTQYIVDSNVLPLFARLLQFHKDNIRKESCWTLSNITAGTVEQIGAVMHANLVPGLINCLANGDYRTRKEACWALSNLSNSGTTEQVQHLIQQGVIKPMVDMLCVEDTKITQISLDAIENVLKAGQLDDGTNPCCDWIEEAGGVDALEELQDHLNEEVYEKALHLIETYYPEDDSAEDISCAPATTASGHFGFGQQQVPAITMGGGFDF
eukprot:m.361567 g.361567  ORF g.361567 m.361567 type:complete len:533 (-) comp19687_c0_seq1:960-2558(-)